MKKRVIKKVELLLEGMEAVLNAFRGDIYPIRNIDIDDDYDCYYKDYEKALMPETIKTNTKKEELKFYHQNKCFKDYQ